MATPTETRQRPAAIDVLFANGSALLFAGLIGAVVWALEIGRF